MSLSLLRFVLTLIAVLFMASSQPLAATKKSVAPRQLSMEVVNDAEWSRGAGARSRALLLKIQVLLDRARLAGPDHARGKHPQGDCRLSGHARSGCRRADRPATVAGLGRSGH